jgi:DNA primase
MVAYPDVNAVGASDSLPDRGGQMSSSARLSPDDITRIRRAHPITDVLYRAGLDTGRSAAGGDLMISGPMPGHEDSTPSCMIHPDTGRFYCFGCGMHGDVFTLVRELTGITSLTRAADVLDSGRAIAWTSGAALRSPVSVPTVRQLEQPVLDRTSAERVVQVNQEAWRFLTSSRLADQGRAYLARRGIDIWRLEGGVGAPLVGYTPASRTGLTDHLCRNGFTAEEVLDAGWALRGSDGLRDRFHRRALLPVRDQHGRIAGVIGRDVTDQAKQKYLNTARTVVYSKGDLLYQPLPVRLPDAVAIVCEGPLDALAIAAAAAPGRGARLTPMAPSGTALTPKQAQQIVAASNRDPVICADADEAGIAAAARWAERLRAEGARPRTVTLPQGHDPASWLQTRGPAAIKLLLSYATQPRLQVVAGGTAQAGIQVDRPDLSIHV